MLVRLVGPFLLGIFVSPLGLLGQDERPSPRTLAPGVLRTFSPSIDARDSFSMPMVMPNLETKEFTGNYASKIQSLFGQTRGVIYFRDVWQYEFSTLGLRQIKLQFKNPDGSLENKHYWYLVYRVRDFGKSISYDEVKHDAVFDYVKHEFKVDDAKTNRELVPQRFVPQMELTGWVSKAAGSYDQVSYRDQYLPHVVREIQRLEDPNQRLFDKMEIGNVEVPLATTDADPGVWGVAVWGNVDPYVNYVSIYVRGVTNAYRILVNAEGNVGLVHKTLQLNYWRPGDTIEQERDFVDFGIPLVDEPEEQIAITRRYDLPGPEIRAYVVNEQASREVFVTGIDAGVDLEDFSSPTTKELDQGKLPAALLNALQLAGTNVTAETAIAKVMRVDPTSGQQIPIQSMWQFDLESNGQKQKWILKFEPQYWEKQGKGIRFIKSLDHLWIYR